VSRAQVAGVVFSTGFQNADVDRFIKIHQVIDSSRATYFCVSHEAIDSRTFVAVGEFSAGVVHFVLGWTAAFDADLVFAEKAPASVAPFIRVQDRESLPLAPLKIAYLSHFWA